MNNDNVVSVDFSSDETPTLAPPPVAAPKKRRGFAAMDPARVREISARGGRQAHALGRAHKWSIDSAREAGRKGGVAPHRSRGRVKNAVVPTSSEQPAT